MIFFYQRSLVVFLILVGVSVTTLADPPSTKSTLRNFPSLQAEGIIGVTEEVPLDNPSDNLFHVNISEPVCAEDKVWLVYELNGVEDHTNVSRSINDQLSVGGYVVKRRAGWREQREQVSAEWLKQGDNVIRFTMPQSATHSYRVKSLRFEIEKSANQAQPFELVLNRPSNAHYDDRAYIKGFVGNNVKALRIRGKSVALYHGEFESVIDIEAIKDFCTVEAELTYTDGTTSCHTIDFAGRMEADYVFTRNGIYYRTEKFVDIKSAIKIELQGAILQAEANVLSAPSHLSITTLRDVDIPALDAGMENVTANHKAYRFLPNGTTFSKEAKLTIPFDSTAIPEGYTAEDIRTYYFDEQAHHWVPVPTDSIVVRSGIIISKTTHFTDYINAIIKVPESPEVEAYNSTSMKGIKAANPMAAVNLINAPQANNTGSATLNYPITIPAGRNGIQPQLNIGYNSSGGNGWMGLGWNLTIPFIGIDTRWGVPRYDGVKETETYSLNGEMLTPVAHRGELVDRSANKNANGSKSFYPRVESAFNKVERFGDTPANYYWVVTDKSGTKYYYGATGPKNGSFDKQSVLRTNEAGDSGNIAQWMLSEVRDLNGNTVKYFYDKPPHFGVAGGRVEGRQIYIKNIVYTGHTSGEGKYKVTFIRDRELKQDTLRADVSIAANLGFKQVTADLLKKIEVQYDGQKIRHYELKYSTGAFYKTLLNRIVEFDAQGIAFTSHSFGYYNDVSANGVYHPFAQSQQWQVNGADGVVRGDFKKRIDGTFDDNASMLSGSKSKDNSLGMTVSVGFNPRVVDKTFSVGGSFNAAGSESESMLTMMDLNGDGLPDKVFIKAGTLHFSPNLSGPAGNQKFGEPVQVKRRSGTSLQPISTFFHEKSKTISGGLEAHGPSYAPLFGGYSRSKTKSEQTIYFTEVNGDQLPDLVDRGTVYFCRINPETGVPEFVDSSSLTPSPIVQGGSISGLETTNEDELAKGIRENPLHDIVRMWEAPYTGRVKITAPVQLLNIQDDERSTTAADGVRLAIQVKDEERWSATIPSDDYSVHNPTGVNDLLVNKGDRIFFRMGSVFNGAYDQVSWSPVIEYTELPFDHKKDVNGHSLNRYESKTDFKLSASQKISVPEKGTIRIESNFIKPFTTDDVQLEIIREITNPNDEQNPDRVISTDTILVKLYSWNTKIEKDTLFNLAVDKGHHLYFKAHSNTNVNWANVNWKTHLFYTALDGAEFQDDELFDENGNPIIEFFPVVEYTMYNTEVRMPEPQRVWTDQDTTTIHVTPLLTLGSAPFIFDGEIYFSVKKADTLLYKDTIVVYHNTIVTELETKEIEVLKDDSVYVEYHVAHLPPLGASDDVTFGLADLITSTEAEIIINDTVKTIQAGFYREANAKRIFGSMYRQWGHFAYHANTEERATSRIIQSELVVNESLKNTPRKDPNQFQDGNDLDSDDTYKPYDEKFIILVPMGKQQVWMGFDNDVYLSAAGVSSSRMGDNDPKASATTSAGGGTGARAINKKSETTNNSYSLGASYAIAGASATFNDGKTKVISDFVDFNGDRYPDIIIGNNVYFTNAQGGFSNQSYTHPDENNSKTTTQAKGYSLSASFTTSKGENGLTTNIGKAVFSIGDGKSSAGLNANKGEGKNDTDFMWLDVNGDGLPDRVSPGGVRLNLGYSFAAEEPWDQNSVPVQKGESTNEGAGLGISLWGGSISGGISLGRSDNKTTVALQDVNSDGLVDIVAFQGDNKALKVRINDGNGFAAAVDWDGANFINRSSSTSQSANVAFTAGLYIPPPVNIKITVNPSYSNGYGASRELAKFTDMDGDGFPDYVTSNRYDDLHVSLSKIGRTNMLKEVKRPLGASFKMTYARLGNTYDLPNSQWVLDSVIVRDGFKNDGVDSLLTTHAYTNGYYDRYERDFYGFEKVTIKQHNTGEKGLPVYTETTQVFENKDYFKKGLLASETMADGQGKKYVEKINTYTLKDVRSEVKFPALTKTEKKFYEGQSEAGKTTSTEFAEFNAYGDVTKYIDRGDEGAEDDLTAVISYHDLDDLYVKNVPKKITVTNGTQTLRRREAVIDPVTADITQIKLYLTETEFAAYDMQYDEYGNLQKITRPKNSKDQRFSLTYEYDKDVHAFTTKVTNSYGYTSESTYDVMFGRLLSSKDLNGNEIKYVLDKVGRIISVTGPYEKGSNKTIEFVYSLSKDQEPTANPAWALTKHYDPANPANTMNTVMFVDGMGKVLQTKKDIAVFDGENKADKDVMNVSGRILFDAFGRATTAYHPITNPVESWKTFIKDFDTETPTATTYDVMDRTVMVTLPDGSITTTEYGFNEDRDGKNQFSTKTTDANGKQTEKFTNIQGQTTAVKNYTSEKEIWTSFKYNALNEQVEATDDLGNTTINTYDNLGRRTQRKHPDAGTTTYRYDLAGNMTELVTANLNKQGQAIEYVYDFERLKEINYPENPENNVRYTYGDAGSSDNRAGRVVLQEDGTGAQEYFYGPFGEVVKNIRTIVLPQFDEQTFTTEWKYDTWNRLTSMIYPDGEEVTFKYNSGGLLRTMDGKKKSATFSYVKQLSYDKFEQRVFLAYGNGTKTTYAYEPGRRRLQNMQAQTSAKRLFMDNVYTYDKVNNILNLKNKAAIPGANLMGGSSEYAYQYDDLYRVENVTGHYKGANEEHSYTLDMSYNSVGSITHKKQIHLKKGQEQKKTTYDIAYSYSEDQPHAPVEVGENTYTYDANGNQTGWVSNKSGQRRDMMWDEDNRLRSVKDNGAFYHYGYDASGERVWKAKSIGQRIFVNGEWKAGSGSLGNYQVYVNPYIVLRSGGYTKHYYIESQRIVSKLGGGIDNNGKGPLKAGDGKVDYIAKRQRIFEGIVKNLKFLGEDGQILTAGKSGKIPPGQINGNTNVAESFRYFFHPDHLGSTSYVTDATGEVFQHVEYFAFGETFVEEHSNTDRTPYLFNGKELDDETGLYYYGARYYDPKTSIWESIDPMAEQAPGWSPYNYNFNNPIRYTDPTGKWPDFSISEVVHTSLDVVGLVPGLGEIADGVNAVIYLAEGNYTDAALSAAAMVPLAGTAATVAKFARKADKAITAIKTVEKVNEVAKNVKKVSLDNNVLVAAIEKGRKADVKKAIGSDEPIVSITAAKEFLVKGDKEALKGFMKETGAKISKNGGSASQVQALQDKAKSMGRAVGKNDASIIAGAANNGATVITNDKKMTNFMNAIGAPVKGF